MTDVSLNLFPLLLPLPPSHSLSSELVETPSGSGPPTREWVLVGVAGKSQRGSNKRLREKMTNMCCEVEAGQQALQEARSQQGLDKRVQDAEGRAQDLQIRLEASKHAYQESQQSLQESHAEKRVLQVQLEAAQAAYHEAQQSLQASQAEKKNLQQSVDEANTRTQDLQRRVQDAERRAEEAERRWVVQRDEINLTDRELGRGGWAVVQVAEFRGVRCAAKCLYEQIVSNYNRRLFIREMNMAARVRHPNLLQFIGATVQGELIILTELMPTSVRRELKNEHPFSQSQITSISLDVVRALNYLHLMQPSPIIHRDISSANVLLEPGPSNSWRAKVSDYGSVNLLERLNTVAPGNPTYAAPEAENTTLQSPKMDIFSFGVLLVEMCSAQFPDVADREHLIYSIHLPGMVALIRRCLAEDRNVRPSASDIITELSEQND